MTRVSEETVEEEPPLPEEPYNISTENNSFEVAEELKESTTLEPSLPTGTTWAEFEEFIRNEIPAISAELEQGNVVSGLEINESYGSIKYGFGVDSQLFYDHLINGEGKEKIQDLMKSFFTLKTASLDLVLLNDEEKEKDNFLSKSEIREKERLEELANKEERLRTHPVIKEAERLFGKEIDRVKVKEE